MEKPGGSKSTSHTTSHRYNPSNIRDQQQQQQQQKENTGKVGGLPAPLASFDDALSVLSLDISSPANTTTDSSSLARDRHQGKPQYTDWLDCQGAQSDTRFFVSVVSSSIIEF
jgi:hypothetical protein